MSEPIHNPRTPQVEVDCIFTDRWSPRSFLEEPLTREHIDTLFEAARWSPSCYRITSYNVCYTKLLRIDVGDQVITSGNGGIFPKGLPVGTVIRVEREEYRITSYNVCYTKLLRDDLITHVDILFPQHEIETQSLAVAAADSTGPVPLNQGGDGRRGVGNQQDPRLMSGGADDSAGHPLGDDHRHPLADPVLAALVDHHRAKPAGRVIGHNLSRKGRQGLLLTEVEKLVQSLVGQPDLTPLLRASETLGQALIV